MIVGLGDSSLDCRRGLVLDVGCQFPFPLKFPFRLDVSLFLF